MPHSTLDKSSRQYNLSGYHTWHRGDLNRQPRCWEVRALTARPSSYVKVQWGNIPDTLVPEIYVIMTIPLKCVAVLFRRSPWGNTTLSAKPAAGIIYATLGGEGSNPPQMRGRVVGVLTSQHQGWRFEFPITMVNLPNTKVDLPNTMVDLPNTMLDLPNTMVDLPKTMTSLTVLLPFLTVFDRFWPVLPVFVRFLPYWPFFTILTVFDRFWPFFLSVFDPIDMDLWYWCHPWYLLRLMV